MDETHTLRENTVATINIDRLSDFYKKASKEQAGCVYLAPLNIYTSERNVPVPRLAFEYLSRLQPLDLHVNIKNIFTVWKDFLPRLGLNIDKVNIHIESITIGEKSIDELLEEAGYPHVDVQNTSCNQATELDANLKWMILLADPNNQDVYHVMSAIQGDHTKAFINIGGPIEYNHYDKVEDYLTIASIGLRSIT